MDATATDDKRGSSPPPSMLERRTLTVRVPTAWVASLKIHGVKTDRTLRSLVEEALIDLADKLKIDLNLIDEDEAGEV